MTYAARQAIRKSLNELDRQDAERNRAIREAMEQMRRTKVRVSSPKKWFGL